MVTVTHWRFFLALLICLPVWAQVAVPPLKGRVTDLTGTLKPEQIASLEQMLKSLEARKGSQIAVLMLPTTAPETRAVVMRQNVAWNAKKTSCGMVPPSRGAKPTSWRNA